MADTKFKKGDKKPPTSGRKKGVRNKFTSDIKKMLLNALNDERIGGEEDFVKWIEASKRNREIFYSWLMKLLPSNIGISGGGEGKKPLPLRIILENANPNDKRNSK